MDTNKKKSDNKNHLARYTALTRAPENYSSLPTFAKGEAVMLFTQSLVQHLLESLAKFSS